MIRAYPLATSVTVPKHTALAAAFIGFGTIFAVIVFAIFFGSLAVQSGRLEIRGGGVGSADLDAAGRPRDIRISGAG